MKSVSRAQLKRGLAAIFVAALVLSALTVGGRTASPESGVRLSVHSYAALSSAHGKDHFWDVMGQSLRRGQIIRPEGFRMQPTAGRSSRVLKVENVLMNAIVANRDVRYNVFRHKFLPELCCAVPEDRPVPRFLNGSWEYAGTLQNQIAALHGFDSAAAEWGVRLTGFHLFHVAPKRSSLAINPEAPTKQCPSVEETVCAYRVQSPTVIVTHAAYPRVLWDSAAQNQAGQTNVTAVTQRAPSNDFCQPTSVTSAAAGAEIPINFLA